jgi:hypothetical protein
MSSIWASMSEPPELLHPAKVPARKTTAAKSPRAADSRRILMTLTRDCWQGKTPLPTCLFQHGGAEPVEPRSERAQSGSEQLSFLATERALDLDAPDPSPRCPLELLVAGALIEEHEGEGIRRREASELSRRDLGVEHVAVADSSLEPCVCAPLRRHSDRSLGRRLRRVYSPDGKHPLTRPGCAQRCRPTLREMPEVERPDIRPQLREFLTWYQEVLGRIESGALVEPGEQERLTEEASAVAHLLDLLDSRAHEPPRT